MPVEVLAAAVADHTGLDVLVDNDTTRWCAAIGAASVLWRDGPIEDLHAGVDKPGGISDAQMMRANVASTRLIAATLVEDIVDWREVAVLLTDPGRLLGEATLSEMVGVGNLAKLRTHALGAATYLGDLSAAGRGWLRTYLACSGATREWFGVPWWPQHVGMFVSEVTDSDSRLHCSYRDRKAKLPAPPMTLDRIADWLVLAPEALPVEVLAWCVDWASLGHVDHGEIRHRWDGDGRTRWSPPSLWP